MRRDVYDDQARLYRLGATLMAESGDRPDERTELTRSLICAELQRIRGRLYEVPQPVTAIAEALVDLQRRVAQAPSAIR